MTNILHPKMNHRFRVLFSNEKLSQVTNQIIRFSPPVLDKVSSEISFMYEDDCINAASKPLHEFFESGELVDVIVEILDGNGYILEQMTFKNSRIKEISYVTPFDYAPPSAMTKTYRVNPSTIIGNLIENDAELEQALSVLTKFFSTSMLVINEEESSSRSIKKQVHLSYQSLKIEFYQAQKIESPPEV